MICCNSEAIIIPALRPVYRNYKESNTGITISYTENNRGIRNGSDRILFHGIISDSVPRPMYKTHPDSDFDFQELCRFTAFIYRQHNIFSMLPEHSTIVDARPSVKPLWLGKFRHDKPGNCAWTNRTSCQEFNSNTLSCLSSELIRQRENNKIIKQYKKH